MIRAVIENIVLFLLPTVIYVIFAVLVRGDKQKPLDDAPVLWLVLGGALLVVTVLVVFGQTSGGHPGQHYDPAVFRDGKLQPGGFH
jgi:hypothetical protein